MEYLFLAIGLIPYGVAALLGLAFPMLLLGAYNRFVVGLVLVALTFFLEVANLGQPILRLGVTIFVPDIPLVVLGIAAGLRWMMRDDVPRRHAAWVVLVVLFFVDLAIGLARHGTGAGVQGRPAFYAIAAATYAMTFNIGASEVRQMVKVLTATCLALMLLCVYRWVVFYAPIPELLPPAGVYSIDGAIRVIGASAALPLAELLVVGLFFVRKDLGARAARWLSPWLLAAVVVLQHRSVWLAGIAGVLMSLLLARAQRVPLWQQVLVISMIVFTVAAPLAFNDTLGEQLQSSAAHAIAGEGTVNARFENWRATIDLWWGDGPRAIAMGRDLGSDTTRILDGDQGQVRIRFGTHNHYVDVLTQFGVLGLAVTLVVFVYASFGLVQLIRKRDETSAQSALLLVLLGMQFVYYVAYTVDYIQYLILGMSVAWVAARRREQNEQRVTPTTPDRAAKAGLLRRQWPA